MNGSQPDGQDDTTQHEIVIIKRRGGDGDEPHKGGVWKIAHADFMTALMAFFLVMWLIGISDEKTISGVANYFNPMRMSDAATKPKGVFTMQPEGARERGSGTPSDTDVKGESRVSEADEAKDGEITLLGNPYEVLEEIAKSVDAREDGNTSLHGDASGDRSAMGFRDPFEPDPGLEASERVTPERQPQPVDLAAAARGGPDGSGRGERAGNKSGDNGAQEGAPASADGSDAALSAEQTQEAARTGSPQQLAQLIEQAVDDAGFPAIPGIQVSETPEGVLINISDNAEFEMFGVSSVRPTAELVVLLERIGKLLQARSEPIVIRGHTDSLKFRSDRNDNWRLSTARAQMAYYMLTRGGVPDDRFRRIEGHADNDLKNAADPTAGENRRVEILLLKGDR